MIYTPGRHPMDLVLRLTSYEIGLCSGDYGLSVGSDHYCFTLKVKRGLNFRGPIQKTFILSFYATSK